MEKLEDRFSWMRFPEVGISTAWPIVYPPHVLIETFSFVEGELVAARECMIHVCRARV